MLNKRTNVLFDEQSWKELSKVAKTKKTSVGELIRTAVKEKYLEDTQILKRFEVIEEIKKIRPKRVKKIDYKELINYGRKF